MPCKVGSVSPERQLGCPACEERKRRMTRKHFEALADALADARPKTSAPICKMQWDECVGGVADVCAQFNPNFDREKFIERASK